MPSYITSSALALSLFLALWAIGIILPTRAKGLRKLLATILIAGGITALIAGILISLEAAEPSKEAAGLVPESARIPILVSPGAPATPIATSSSASPPSNQYDRERRLVAIDQFLDLLNSDGDALYKNGLKIRDHWNANRSTSLASLAEELQGIRSNVLAFHEALETLVKRHAAYPEIAQTHLIWYFAPIFERTNLTLSSLDKISKEYSSDVAIVAFRHSPVMEDWANALNNFHNWVAEKRSYLLQKRRE